MAVLIDAAPEKNVFRLIFGFLWILLCSGLFFGVLHRDQGRFIRRDPFFLLGSALFIRLVPAIILQQGASYEMHLFQEIAAQMLSGENVLTRLPYLPFFVYWISLAEWFAQTVGGHFTFWLKLPSILADVSIVVVLYQYMVRLGTSNSKVNKSLWLYALNPIGILVSGYHGQFDTFALLFLVLSIVILEQHNSRLYVLVAGLVLGVGILAKTWPGLLIPVVIVNKNIRQKILFVFGTSLAPLVGVLASVIATGNGIGLAFKIISNSLRAGAIPGWWGYTGMVNGLSWLLGQPAVNFDGLIRFKLLIVFVPVIATIFASRKKPIPWAFLNALLVLFIFAPGFGLQSLSWLIPFFICYTQRDNILLWYVGLSLFHMLISYWGIHFTPALYTVFPGEVIRGIVQLSAVPVWVLLVALVLRRLMGRAIKCYDTACETV